LGRVRKGKWQCPECGYYAFGGKVHGSCARKRGLEGRMVIWKYEGVIRKAIIKLKYGFASEIAEELAECMVIELEKSKVWKERMVVVPVPLAKARGRWRGFNQAGEIGKRVASGMGWEYWPDLLVRRQSTKPQVELSGEERAENVKGVFSVNPAVVSRGSSDIFYCSASRPGRYGAYYENASLTASKAKTSVPRVVIFDDVWTTGATTRECGKVLKKAGVERVWGMAVAG